MLRKIFGKKVEMLSEEGKEVEYLMGAIGIEESVISNVLGVKKGELRNHINSGLNKVQKDLVYNTIKESLEEKIVVLSNAEEIINKNIKDVVIDEIASHRGMGKDSKAIYQTLLSLAKGNDFVIEEIGVSDLIKKSIGTYNNARYYKSLKPLIEYGYVEIRRDYKHSVTGSKNSYRLIKETV